MSEAKRNPFVRALVVLWRILDGARKLALNVIFLALLLLFFAATTGDAEPEIRERTTLVLDPVGSVVEQYSSDPLERALNEALGQPREETRFRDLLTAVGQARDDERISQLVLDVDGMLAIGPAQLQELRRAIEAFRAAGKTVLAYSEGMAQEQLYLASAADELWLHPEGLVLIEGYGVFRNYFRELLETLSVDVHLFRVGEYKSAAEPYVRNDMSPESREANRYWLDGLWQVFVDDLARLRDLSRESLLQMIDEPSVALAAADGSPARMALDQRLVDRIGTREEFVARVIAGGAEGRGGDEFRRIGYEPYARFAPPRSLAPDKVAVVVAQGPILYGEQPPGTIGGDSIVAQIEAAQEDPRVKAIVLRVDSPGGAVLPSEKIRAAVAAARDAGLPVVVSMGTVAASGGYWISMSADEIVAEATTITGSIGIYGLITTIPASLARIGVHTDGVGTTALAGTFRLDRPLGAEAQRLIQLIIEDGYRDFVGKVATARNLEVAEVDTVARGRVWTGAQALERGLVDRLGGLTEALDVAAARAKLDDYGVLYFEEKPSPFEQWLMTFSTTSVGRTVARLARHPLAGLADAAEDALPAELRLLLQQPRTTPATYAYCFCEP